MLGQLAPLTVAMPIAGACVVLVAGSRLPRLVTDLLGIAVAATVTALAGVLAAAAGGGRVVTWTGGWLPSHGRSPGIVLVADPAGAGAACLAGALMTCALLYSWRYLESAQTHYHALMLLFLAGMAGFALTGDLFDMFVFFELMGAVAYALTGLRIEEPDSVQGGLNFAVINSLGAYLSLVGIGLLYARTGELGLAQIGTALSGRGTDGLVVAAFVLATLGFLVKAAMVPMHFWLADAHAVAPAPVCVLMSGIMVELGVYALARVYVVVFPASVPAAAVQHAFVVMGLLTAAVGSVMCLAQRHIKRLLAYSTIAHVGLFLLAFAALSPESFAGGALYVAGHAGVKGSLFLIAGVLLNRYRSVDEDELFGRGRPRDAIAWLFLAAGLALAGLPPFGPGLGKGVAEEAVAAAGYPWLVAAFVLVSALTGGAVLRVGLRVFLGWGVPPRRQPSSEETSGEGEEPETGRAMASVPWSMLAAIALLLSLGLAVGLVPRVAAAAGRGAVLFADPAGYAGQALRLAPGTRPAPLPAVHWTGGGVLLGVVSTFGALGVAAAGLRPDRLRRLTAVPAAGAGLRALRRLHSGHVGDYVGWLFLGAAVLAALIGLPLLG